eukprot:TRINITY_DN3492_c0_g1_i13.p1 TRINITY_DN3492_c0_g1~~TRINITY_DN3492_c0_g1_i13.p1  ORF type:complete len:300 (+),score=57.08 TRINITY_DN3492_c0_g1_i13:239-1138(+)
MSSRGNTFNSKAQRKKELLHCITSPKSSNVGLKNSFATTTHQARNHLQPHLLSKRVQPRNTLTTGNSSIVKADAKSSKSKKGAVEKKMQFYKTMRFPSKAFSLVSSDTFEPNSKKRVNRRLNEAAVPITLRFSSLEQHVPLKQSTKKPMTEYLKMEVIVSQVREYLSYSDFYHLLITSKQIFNQDLLTRLQVALIVRGLPRETREKLWRQKCRITQKQPSYNHYCLLPTDCEHDIAKDITRTFIPSHEFSRDSNNCAKLQRVLHAFAVRHPEIGYIQGLNFVAGNLVLQFPEEVTVVCV